MRPPGCTHLSGIASACRAQSAPCSCGVSARCAQRNQVAGRPLPQCPGAVHLAEPLLGGRGERAQRPPFPATWERPEWRASSVTGDGGMQGPRARAAGTGAASSRRSGVSVSSRNWILWTLGYHSVSPRALRPPVLRPGPLFLPLPLRSIGRSWWSWIRVCELACLLPFPGPPAQPRGAPSSARGGPCPVPRSRASWWRPAL